MLTHTQAFRFPTLAIDNHQMKFNIEPHHQPSGRSNWGAY